MSVYEFKMIPAPERPVRKKGAAKGEDLFCATLTDVVNEMAAEGWEYIRCEALPMSHNRWAFWARRRERQVFVFRRLRVRSTLLPSPDAVASARHLIPIQETEAVAAQRRLSDAIANRRPSVAIPPAPVRAEDGAAVPVALARSEAARPPLAPQDAPLSVAPRRVSDPVAVQRIKSGVRRVSVRPPNYAAE